eukprot:TRINITY_DN70141_c0_g1_i1.p1 TRINITY_DN70141_c0_g1~~TRINITY_DN70141_c0_g1_i1.p1  ORF type:complete len:1091 (+),score=189.95 TRINITY_DN70141_c0_g1_i1:83-3274(+)
MAILAEAALAQVDLAPAVSAAEPADVWGGDITEQLDDRRRALRCAADGAEREEAAAALARSLIAGAVRALCGNASTADALQLLAEVERLTKLDSGNWRSTRAGDVRERLSTAALKVLACAQKRSGDLHAAARSLGRCSDGTAERPGRPVVALALSATMFRLGQHDEAAAQARAAAAALPTGGQATESEALMRCAALHTAGLATLRGPNGNNPEAQMSAKASYEAALREARAAGGGAKAAAAVHAIQRAMARKGWKCAGSYPIYTPATVQPEPPRQPTSRRNTLLGRQFQLDSRPANTTYPLNTPAEFRPEPPRLPPPASLGPPGPEGRTRRRSNSWTHRRSSAPPQRGRSPVHAPRPPPAPDLLRLQPPADPSQRQLSSETIGREASGYSIKSPIGEEPPPGDVEQLAAAAAAEAPTPTAPEDSDRVESPWDPFEGVVLADCPQEAAGRLRDLSDRGAHIPLTPGLLVLTDAASKHPTPAWRYRAYTYRHTVPCSEPMQCYIAVTSGTCPTGILIAAPRAGAGVWVDRRPVGFRAETLCVGDTLVLGEDCAYVVEDLAMESPAETSCVGARLARSPSTQRHVTGADDSFTSSKVTRRVSWVEPVQETVDTPTEQHGQWESLGIERNSIMERTTSTLERLRSEWAEHTTQDALIIQTQWRCYLARQELARRRERRAADRRKEWHESNAAALEDNFCRSLPTGCRAWVWVLASLGEGRFAKLLWVAAGAVVDELRYFDAQGAACAWTMKPNGTLAVAEGGRELPCPRRLCSRRDAVQGYYQVTMLPSGMGTTIPLRDARRVIPALVQLAEAAGVQHDFSAESAARRGGGAGERAAAAQARAPCAARQRGTPCASPDLVHERTMSDCTVPAVDPQAVGRFLPLRWVRKLLAGAVVDDGRAHRGLRLFAAACRLEGLLPPPQPLGQAPPDAGGVATSALPAMLRAATSLEWCPCLSVVYGCSAEGAALPPAPPGYPPAGSIKEYLRAVRRQLIRGDRDEAACVVTNAVRRLVCRRRVEQRRRERATGRQAVKRHDAAVLIQRQWRGVTARAEAARRRQQKQQLRRAV